MTKESFLLDTLEYYSMDVKRRCTNGLFCRYSPISIGKTYKESAGCGIGRKLKRSVAEELDKCGACSIREVIIDYPILFELSPKWMQKMEKEFLTAIQTLHDRYQNWNKRRGLSKIGRKFVREIIGEFNLNKELFKKYI